MAHSAHNLGLRFQRTAEASPEEPALFCEGKAHNFRFLNNLANRMARWLIAQGVMRGRVVCIELPKIVEACALALASIKIGAPHVFLDPAAPVDRARRMLERCHPALVVSVRAGEYLRCVIADGALRENLQQQLVQFEDHNLPQTEQVTGIDPAYVMFTSGSTGEPKGAVIPHRGVLNLVEWASQALTIGKGDRLTNVNPLYFDNSVFDTYCGLLNGAAIVALNAMGGVRRRSW
ncbi:MAG: AMP-binding protein [Xanthobacteraceae bacterium]